MDVGSSEALLLSWRPDGRVLAATSSFLDTVSLFDCTSGKERASLVLPTYSGSTIGGETSLRWSPDGSQLLALAPGRGAIIVQYLGEIKLARGRMTLPVIHSLWQSGTRNIHLDGFNEATGCAISGILTFGGGDEQGPAVLAS